MLERSTKVRVSSLLVFASNLVDNESEGTVASHVAGCTKRILKGEDGNEHCCAGIIELEYADDNAKRSKYRSTRDTWSTNSKDAEKDDEECKSGE